METLLFALISKIQFYHNYFFSMLCVAAVNNDTLLLRIYSALSFLQQQTSVKSYLWCLQELQQHQGFGHTN